MNKSWLQASVYFLNGIYHVGVFLVLFTVAIPEFFTIQEYVVDFWSYPEGKEIIIINTAFLIGNFIFAFIIISFVNKSLLSIKVLAFLAWIIVLLIYLFGVTGLMFTYVLGAISLTFFSYKKHKNA